MDSSQIVLCSISLDESESVFSETVKLDRLNESTQFHDCLGIDSEVYEKYRLNRGLRNFLINSEGIVVASDISPEQLEKILNQSSLNS